MSRLSVDDSPRKKLLKASELISHMSDRGIKFEKISVEDAERFLIENNNYFKLTSYRKNYLKHIEGKAAGKYIDLDFAYLVDLSTIDMYLRNFLLKISLDIEHYIKVNLLAEIEDNKSEDGYKIVTEYIKSKQDASSNKVIIDISKNSGSPYCGELLAKFNINKSTKEIYEFPVWAFVEVISFGTLRDFYKFYYKYYKLNDKHNIGFLLQTVNQLRNAVAHNNCIINNLYPIEPQNARKINTDNRVSNFISSLGIGKSMKSKKMKNPRINQIVTTLYVFDKVVTSKNVKKYRYKELDELVNDRMKYRSDYYSTNETIKTAYEFLQKISNNLYKEYSDDYY